jgi:hypothetical protein
MLFAFRVSAALAACAMPCVAAETTNSDELKPDELKISMWDRSTNLRGAFGYKDNVLLSKNNPEASFFWQSGLDFSLLRLAPESGSTLSFFLTGDDRRYFSADSVNKEQLFLVQAKIARDIGQNWQLGVPINYSYIDEVFDASTTEQIFETLPVKSHRAGVAPYVSRSLPWNSTLELKFYVDRQLYNEPLDDYWEYGPQLTWRKPYGNRSELTVSYTFRERPYDTREFVTLDFFEIPGTSLRYDQHEFELILNHSWDAERRWRIRTRFGYTLNQENGTGFYDFNRYRFAQKAGYYAKSWQAAVEAKILHYDYVRQPIPDVVGTRNIWEFVLGVRLEKNLLPKLKLFLESEHEWVDSNNTIEEYHVNTVMSGVDWEF